MQFESGGGAHRGRLAALFIAGSLPSPASFLSSWATASLLSAASPQAARVNGKESAAVVIKIVFVMLRMVSSNSLVEDKL